MPFDHPDRVSFWSVNRVRQVFIDFFCKENGHTFVPSSGTIPHDDPTLLFANSGMAQFKPIFQGVIDPAAPFAKLRRAANSQKCIRAGGKHNDLEDVGKDVYHHTFFEMLGNWSFGDYFKKEAIDMAWDLLTKVYGIPEERLYVTYFGGNETFNLPADLEARDMWISKGMAPERVLPFGMKENFWEMGESGPCGPCSEIHFDRIGGRDAAAMVNADDPDVLEIWNLVFMQYNREADGSLRPLPNKHVDTGMGLERVTSVLQCKRSNYDTDVFMPLFEAIQAASGAAPYAGRVGRKEDPEALDMAYRVLADHIRTLTFSIADGGVPSNEGRGYVLRRILRRAIRYAHEKLKAPAGAFATLVDCVVNNFSAAFPELAKNPERIRQLLLAEEQQFRKTLDRGLVQFERFASAAAAEGRVCLTGEEAWRLYDTFGFPVDLTKLMAEERGMCVDEAGYAAAQAAAKERSRSGKGGEGVIDPKTAVVLDVHLTAELDSLNTVKTDDSHKYTSEVHEGCRVAALVQDGRLVQNIAESDALVGIILDRTNFYAEEGGQQSDIGSLQALSAGEQSTIAEFEVLSVQVYSGWVLHIGRVKFGAFNVGQEGIQAAFDEMNRRSLRQNHSATHLLNFAIRSVVTGGDEQIDQKGSLVASDRFRFDFNWSTALTDAQVGAIEAKVRECVAADVPVATAVVPLAKAREINGLRAVFGETYPDPVRVVVMGVKDLSEVLAEPASPRWAAMSVELCGGTHVSKTSQIGAFVILAESNISKGIRRIVAVTGESAERSQEAAAALEARVGYTEAALKEAEVEAKSAATPVNEIALTSCDSSIKALGKEIDEAVIPAVIKSALRERAVVMRKSVGDALKALRAVLSARVVDEVIASLSTVKLSDSRVLIKRVDGADARTALLPALQKMVKTGAGVDAVAVILYAVDEVAKRVFYHAAALKSGEADAAALLQKFGSHLEAAKCGGSAALAQGSALIPEGKVDWESEFNF